MSHQQLHKRLSSSQVETILASYLAKEISLDNALQDLDIKRSRFFDLVKSYRDDPDNFNLDYKRKKTNNKIDAQTEKHIICELKEDKKLIENKDMPIKFYNYSAIRDNLIDKYGIKVSVPTIINRAKNNDCYLEKPPKKIHDREVLTNFIGELVQHDSSHHQWSPYMNQKLYLITSLDDHSRLLLFADLFTRETSWRHIWSAKSVVLQYGCALKYYPDQHSIFRYVKDRDKNSPWNTYTKFTDEVDPQWKQVLKDCGIDVTYALSPQAKGKVERPYRWIQDRIVRTAAKEKLSTLEELRKVLNQLVYKYNHKWVHSTTGEIPIIRFEEAKREQRSLFKPFKFRHPYDDLDDIFCLRFQRNINPYRKIQISGLEIKVPGGIPRQKVDIRAVPDVENNLARLRFWQGDTFLGNQNVKLSDLPIVQF